VALLSGTISEWKNIIQLLTERIVYLFEVSLAMDHLADILLSLGISEYLGRFIHAGFLTWEALLEITGNEL
jgi:hypothetical protein